MPFARVFTFTGISYGAACGFTTVGTGFVGSGFGWTRCAGLVETRSVRIRTERRIFFTKTTPNAVLN
jgi:hypothetical protein